MLLAPEQHQKVLMPGLIDLMETLPLVHLSLLRKHTILADEIQTPNPLGVSIHGPAAEDQELVGLSVIDGTGFQPEWEAELELVPMIILLIVSDYVLVSLFVLPHPSEQVQTTLVHKAHRRDHSHGQTPNGKPSLFAEVEPLALPQNH